MGYEWKIFGTSDIQWAGSAWVNIAYFNLQSYLYLNEQS